MKKEEIQRILDLLIHNTENIKLSLPVLKENKKQIQKGVYLGKGVIVEPNVFFDVSQGEIVVGDNTKVKANSVLRGPLVIGRDSIINSFAEISCSQIGDVCKVGGEVEGSIISNYSNKQHYGCLGHSYVGSWVNIGGGTSVSDLKNTYSSIQMGGIDTGLQHLGVIIGDYVKTAINTSIFCGKVIGSSAHLYGTVTGDVPAFTSHVSTGVMHELPFDLADRIQRTMAKRRNVEWTKEDTKKFKKLFDETAKDRKLAKVKKSKLSFK
jgi:glucose-1-phosphate thymidylyltransferase